ncbi:polyprenyl synthetase family protein [Brachybacterium huguangmaarense]
MRSSLGAVPDVEDALADVLVERLDRVEERLHEIIAISDTMVSWTSRHLMDAGGKRVRPLLTLLGAAFGDIKRPGVVDAAVLVELTHLATLYHDDVMDDAATRRGARTAHEIWGNSVAILTGDFLFARASALSSGLGPDAVLIHSRTFERLCLGQLHETVGPQEGEDRFEQYLGVLADKTASLLATAGRLGALQAGCTEAVADTLARYGEKVGVAFQLADDVLDLRSDPETSGKTPGTDLREGVDTMPTLLVRRRVAQGDDAPASRRLVELLDSDHLDGAELDEALELLRADPAVEETAAMARATADEAIAILDELPAGPARDALVSYTRTLAHRDA